jgi:YidC/Oxa1 family membrane protein insertase
MPAMMGLYWIEQSVLAIIQEAILNKVYQGQIDAEMAEFVAKEKAREEELERKRAETERLKAEGKTQMNANTSKKRLAAQEKNAEEQRQAALRAADRAAKGLVSETPASQVGTRRFARGRAYDPERFAEGEEAPAETGDASEESKE